VAGNQGELRRPGRGHRPREGHRINSPLAARASNNWGRSEGWTISLRNGRVS